MIRLNKWVAFALKAAVSAGLIAWLAMNMDIAAAWQRMTSVAPGMLFLALVMMVAQLAICVFRWMAVMRAIGATLPWRAASRIFLVGTFFNQALPSAVGGDAIRIYMTHRAGLRLGRAFNSVMLERVTIVVAIPILLILVLPWFLADVPDRFRGWILAAIAALAVASVAGIAVLILLKRLPEAIRHWRLVAGLVGLGDDARGLFLSGRRTAAAFAWSVLGNANASLVVYFLGVGLGIDFGVVDVLAIFPMVLLATTVPISIGGWGVREGAMVFGFAMVGVPEDASFALSVLYGLLVLLVSLLCGPAWLFGRNRPAVADLSKTSMP